MKKRKYLQLTSIHFIGHYFLVIIPLLLFGMNIFYLVEKFIFEKNNLLISIDIYIIIASIMLILAFLIYIVLKRKLKFKEVDVTFTDKEFQEAIQRTAEEYEWEIETNNKNIFRAFRHGNWTASPGEMITIIKDNDSFLINSICNPNKRTSISSFGWNKRNICNFIKNLEDVKNNMGVDKKIEIPENQWTLDMIFIRLFFYPFSLFLIGLGIYMFFYQSNYIGLWTIGIPVLYLYFDLALILKGKKQVTNSSLSSSANKDRKQL